VAREQRLDHAERANEVRGVNADRPARDGCFGGRVGPGELSSVRSAIEIHVAPYQSPRSTIQTVTIPFAGIESRPGATGRQMDLPLIPRRSQVVGAENRFHLF
jgi:hypothetical protein